MEGVANLKSRGISSRVKPLGHQPYMLSKFSSTLSIVIIGVLALLYGVLMATDIVFGLGLLAVLIGLFLVMVCLISPRTGFYIIVVFSFFINYVTIIARAFLNLSMPVGVFFDILVGASLLGLIVNRYDFKANFNRFTKYPLVIFILFALVFSTIQFFNPNSSSTTDNIQSVRKFIGYVILMYMAYCLFTDFKKVREFVKLLFIVSIISALYGIKQKMFGFFNYELELLMSDPLGWGLIFNNGDIRISSTMSDPAAYGIAMSACSILFLILSTVEKSVVKKRAMIIGSIIMIIAMGYSGTRTAYAMLVVGLAFYIMLTIDKKPTRIFALVSVPALLFLLYAPIYGNNTIQRFRTTFVGAEDQSYKVRVLARAFIQPYIRSHPIGGGLGTTGYEGYRNHPYHYLAMFQPDSGYVKRAAETGWTGLLVTCILYLMALIVAVKGVFRTRNPNVKIMAVACAATLFSFYIAEFAQQAIGQMTDVVIYYPILAILLKLKHFDDEQERLSDRIATNE